MDGYLITLFNFGTSEILLSTIKRVKQKQNYFFRNRSKENRKYCSKYTAWVVRPLDQKMYKTHVIPLNILQIYSQRTNNSYKRRNNLFQHPRITNPRIHSESVTL